MLAWSRITLSLMNPSRINFPWMKTIKINFPWMKTSSINFWWMQTRRINFWCMLAWSRITLSWIKLSSSRSGRSSGRKHTKSCKKMWKTKLLFFILTCIYAEDLTSSAIEPLSNISMIYLKIALFRRKFPTKSLIPLWPLLIESWNTSAMTSNHKSESSW
jgi:hypothetical protein